MEDDQDVQLDEVGDVQQLIDLHSLLTKWAAARLLPEKRPKRGLLLALVQLL